MSTAGHHFCFGSTSSFFLELFLHSSPVAILDTYQPGGLIFQFHISLPFHTVYEIRRCLLLGRKFSCDHPQLNVHVPYISACWGWLEMVRKDCQSKRHYIILSIGLSCHSENTRPLNNQTTVKTRDRRFLKATEESYRAVGKPQA